MFQVRGSPPVITIVSEYLAAFSVICSIAVGG